MNARIGMIGRLVLFLVALCGSSMASAAVVGNLGTLVQGVEVGFTRSPPTTPSTFNDEWNFTLASTSSVSVRIENLAFGVLFGIDNLDGNIDGIITPSGLNFVVNGLAAGPHQLFVKGYVSGLYGGIYAGGITAVPLPPAIILFGSVLFGFAVVARKRKMGEGTLAA